MKRLLMLAAPASLLAFYVIAPSLSPAVWAWLAAVVPVVLLFVGVVMVAFGLVVWLHRLELRDRLDGVTYSKWGRW